MQNGKKVTYNLILGFTGEAVTLLLGIIIPRLVLTSYGSEINGLLTSVTQFYSYIALLEAGVGTASLQAMYRTLGTGNLAGTNAVLAATNHYYHRTGILYLIAIFLFSAVYPLVVATKIPVATIVLIIVFNGLGSVVSYFVQGKYMILLQAEGKNYIQTTLNMIISVLKNVAKIMLIASGFSVVFVQFSAMVIGLLQMLYVAWYIKKKYAWIDLSVKPDYAAIAQSKNVLVHQLSGLIFNNTDAIILTLFCGLKTVSVYSMYTLLFSMISMILNTCSSSIVFLLAQSFHKDRAHFYKLNEVFELYYMAVVFSLYTIANLFILPFMKLYTAGISDINYIDKCLPLLFISTYLLSTGRKSSSQAINFAQHFKQTQWRSIFESCINLTVSLIAVFKFGIYGVLIGTIAALLYRTNDMIIYANKKILHRSPWITYRRWLLNLALFIGITLLSKAVFAHIALDSYFSIIVWAAVCCVVIIPFFFVTVSLFDRETYRFAKELLTPYAKSALAKLKRS